MTLGEKPEDWSQEEWDWLQEEKVGFLRLHVGSKLEKIRYYDDGSIILIFKDFIISSSIEYLVPATNDLLNSIAYDKEMEWPK
jgi:hypothetical protein